MASTPTSPQAALRTLRLIGIALGGGVTLFAVVAFLVRQQGELTGSVSPVLLYLWIAMATSLAAASMILWRGKVVPHLERPEAPWHERATGIQTGLVMTWALVEGGALFGVVVYLLTGITLAGLLGVAMMWAALAFTWPQPEWLATGGTLRE